MKILITTDLYFIETNGVVTSVKNLSEELRKRGHEVKILTMSNDSKDHKGADETFIRSMPIGVYKGVRMPLVYRGKLIREIIDWKPDVIHSQCEIFSFEFARYISKKTGAPIVHTYHTMYEDYVGYIFPIKRLGKWIIRKATKNRLEKTDSVIVPTEKVKQKHIEDGVRCDFNVVPSGISLEQHKTRITHEERQKMRLELGISEDKLVLVSLGRIAAEKNIDELMQLYAKAVKKYENLVFLIVGDGPARSSLEKLAEELGISSTVVFTGMVKPDEVQKYYQLGDIFVSASTSETQGLTYIEAAANALPLICRHDKCLENIIINGENGFEYENEEEFLEALDKLAATESIRQHAGQRSEEIAEPYDKRVFAETVEKIYESVIEQTKHTKELCTK